MLQLFSPDDFIGQMDILDFYQSNFFINLPLYVYIGFYLMLKESSLML